MIDPDFIARARLAAGTALAPTGALAAAIPHYEDRPGQRAMAQAVSDALSDNRPLLVEAGTGVGKTLAYLVPALQSGKRVVVSTGTKALQEQIARNDVPLLRTFVAAPFTAAVLKGVSNYVCLRRIADLKQREPAKLVPLAAWLDETTVGDRAEVDHIADGDPLWAEITNTPDSRVGARCPFFERCFITTARRAAEKANLVIVNHHLYFADLALRAAHRGGKILPAHEAVIFDEAHQLEDVATEHFSARFSTIKIAQLIRDAHQAMNQMALWTGVAGDDSLRQLERASIAFFADVRAALVAAAATAGASQPERTADRAERVILPTGFFDTERRDAWFKLDVALEEVARQVEQHCEAGPDDESAQDAGVRGSLETVARRARDLRDDLALIAEQRQATYVFWGEVRSNATLLSASPVHVGELVKRRVVHGNATAIFTSATLSVGDSFAFTRHRLGLHPEEVDELKVVSPFNYAEQAMLYAPRDLPLPSSDAFSTSASARALELLQITHGRAIILCTSLRAVAEFANALRSQPYQLLVQGEAPRSTLLEQFRSAKRGVLIGAATFWEGVDVPGDQLSLVIIDKLPFAVHTEPLFAARAEAELAAGRDPFATVQLPAAAISLRQGFGRLIRRRDDRGIVAVLDPRLVTKGYGRVFFAALPPELRRTSALEPLKRWWLSPTHQAPA
jgi:ATP-dependent DNA helicase DinG